MNEDDRIPRWESITDEASANALLDAVKGFHDVIATNAAWTGAETVNARGQLELRGFGTLRVSFVSQFAAVGAFEMRFRGVEEFRYRYRRDSEGTISFVDGRVRTTMISWEISSAGVDWRSLKS